MLPVLRLGPFTLPAAPLVLIAVFFTLQEVGDRAAKRLNLPVGVVSTALFWTFGVGLVAARLGYVARNLDAYLADPLQTVGLNFGTLDPMTGALFGIVAGLAYLQRKRINLRLFGDALAPALALALAVYSFGNLLTGDGYGIPAPNLPWAISLWGERRHPTQLYELAVYLAIFMFVWFRAPLAARHADRLSSDLVHDNTRAFDGAPFLITVALLAGARLLLEPLRGDSVGWVAGLRLAQVMAFVILTLSLLLLAYGLRSAPALGATATAAVASPVPAPPNARRKKSV